jgi:phospholipase/carboxylesterase
VLVGFSQGTMMALHAGLRRAVAPAGIVAYSGLLAGPEHLAEANARPPVLLVHGEADDLISVEALHMAREALANAGLPVEWHVRPRLGHGIDPEGQWMAANFIAEVLRGAHGM